MAGGILCFDIETDGIGGFRPPKQRAVQIAWDYDDEAESHLINDVTVISPLVPHPYRVQDCTERGVSFEECFGRFMDVLRRCTMVVAHNLEFDMGVLANELKIRGHSEHDFEVLMKAKGHCTMKRTVDLCCIPKTGNAAKYGGYKYPSLKELYMRLTGQPVHLKLHDARNDVRVLKQCVAVLLSESLVLRKA